VWLEANRRAAAYLFAAAAAAIGSPIKDMHTQENRHELGAVLLIVLVLLLIGVLPTWPHNSSWGYEPIGGLGLVLISVLEQARSKVAAEGIEVDTVLNDKATDHLILPTGSLAME
jgi:hypothetical protein